MSNEKSFNDGSIFDRLKKVRKNAGLSQEVFAEKIGIKQNSYSEIESGKREPSPPIISTIAYRFAINEDWLKTGKGEMFEAPKNISLHRRILAAEVRFAPERPSESVFEPISDYRIPDDSELAEIVDILVNDLPEDKPLILNLLRSRKGAKVALEAFKEPLKEG